MSRPRLGRRTAEERDYEAEELDEAARAQAERDTPGREDAMRLARLWDQIADMWRQAADERKAAAADREAARLLLGRVWHDRRAAAEDRLAAAEDRLAAARDREAAAADREAASASRQQGAVERAEQEPAGPPP